LFCRYGTLEDSLQNCLALVPKPPRRDMHKLMNKDKIILRFTVSHGVAVVVVGQW
jgi:hypothetical protein